MAFQVSLTTSTSPTSYSVSPVNVEGLADLRQELEKRGAKRWARYWRDALNDSHVEGGFRMGAWDVRLPGGQSAEVRLGAVRRPEEISDWRRRRPHHYARDGQARTGHS